MNYYKEYIKFLIDNKIIKSESREHRKEIFGGHSTESVLNCIGSFLSKSKYNNILEIGTNHGFSLGFMKFISPESNVITLDIIKYKEVEEYVIPYIKQPYQRLIASVEDLSEIMDNNNKLNFIYIDGSHSYSSVKNDWLSIQPYLAPDAIIIFDDLGYIDNSDSEPGVTKLFNEITGLKKEIYNEFGVVYND